MKLILFVFFLFFFQVKAGQIGDQTIEGVVKGFDEKYVRIEKNGEIFEFNINRVVNRKALKVGKPTKISLEIQK